MLRPVLLLTAVALTASAETHRFEPTEYHNTFSFAHKPVLRIKPGDRVITKTIDARGFDEKGVQRGQRSNPQTGPFFIEGAEAGDTLVVYIEKLEPNRATGFSSDVLAPYTADPAFLRAEGERQSRTVIWQIDKVRGTARPDPAGLKRANFEIPLRPMLGCIGVAPARKEAIATSTPDTFGGNMDYNGMGAGVKLMLPVSEPGALLFLGDGHAAQGDGEVLGNAIETSLDVEFRVDLIKKKSVGWPRFETADHIGVLGSARPLLQAMQHATTELQRWLIADYGFDERGSSLLLGQGMQMEVANIVDPHFTAVAKMRKSLLAGTPAPQATAPPFVPKPEDLAKFRGKVQELAAAVAKIRNKPNSEDVEIYLKAGQMLLEFPDEFNNQAGMDRAFQVVESGLSLASQATSAQAGRRRAHGFRSRIDGSVQPYTLTLPERYDPARPVPLYVWLHGRANTLTEAEFLHGYEKKGVSKPPVADQGQIQVDIYGRRNGAGYHWAAEADIFETIAAVAKRYKIDPNRIVLRGYSMGGEGAWHIALHYPDRFAAAEIGAGTISARERVTPDLTDYQRATLRVYENMPEWSMNAFNLPLAGHDGDTDTQTCCVPALPPGTKHRGQLESSLAARAQMEKEGFTMDGEPDYLKAKGTRSMFLISQNTGHSTSPLVRERLDAWLKEQTGRGRVSPDRVRFITWTTRYDSNYWVKVDGLQHHYQRSTVDAERLETGARYRIATTNIARLTLTETAKARELEIDGQKLTVKASPALTLERTSAGWRVAASKRPAGLVKTHGQQGPIEDAFLDEFLCVRPTGKPWNEAVHQQSLKVLERFDTRYTRWMRAHPRIVNDTDLTEADFRKYNVVLFGDPGSNPWIAKLLGKLPVQWTRDTVAIGGEAFPAASHYPALIYPSPLGPGRYVVLNTGFTFSDREHNGDYNMPRYGDFGILRVAASGELPDVIEAATAGLFDENWRYVRR
ncbi:MAG: acetamidase/formamidase family protein [Bryobacteraceae bacterium]|nr:acetamidase/formamidase family protein [Bryobacteraceae bacterium]